MSKEKKLAKKEAKSAKKVAKQEKKQAAAYAKLVKKIEKKNAKDEVKANKKGKPFVPMVIPTQEEAFAAAPVNNKKQVVKLIVLLLLIAYIIYFLVMWFTFVAPVKSVEEEEDPSSVAQEYDRYVNEHKITTTPIYSVSDAKNLLKQVLHDNWQDIGYSSDPSYSAINYTSSMITINNADCYVFTASGLRYAVSVKLQSVYVYQNGNYVPLTFHNTNMLTFEQYN